MLVCHENTIFVTNFLQLKTNLLQSLLFVAISSFPLQSCSKNNLFSIAQKELPPVALLGKKTIVFFASVFSL
jgi:hypothetical protein